VKAGQSPFLTLNAHLRKVFGERVQKIPLDAGFTCPNRDGTKGRSGCIYCDPRGSGTGAWALGKSVSVQMAEGMKWARRRYCAKRFIAYFQAFSNTYAPLHVLGERYRESLLGPEVVGLAIGTRPDCVDEERLSLIRQVADGRMIWMEYGLQSASDETLRRINRGHTVDDFVKAVELTQKHGIPVCTHVMFGLPGEGEREMERTMGLLADLGVEGVKFHQVYVVPGTVLHRLYESGRYQPISQEEYAGMVARAIRMLPEGTVIHRLTGDPSTGISVSPAWSRDKQGTIARIEAELDRMKAA